MVPGPLDQLDHVLDERVRDMNLMHNFHRTNQVFGRTDGSLGQDVELGAYDRTAFLALYAQRQIALSTSRSSAGSR